MKGPWGKNTLVESLLERVGAVYALQTWRKRMITEPGELETAYGKLFLLEWLFRHLAQRETALLNKINNTPKDDENTNVSELREELEELNSKYWFSERGWWYLRTSEIPADSFARGFDLWRSHPRWYLHRVLREDCAQRGGCCARACGCCLVPPRPGRALSAGHCTVACGCCETVRGFEWTGNDLEMLVTMFFPAPVSEIPVEWEYQETGDYFNKFKTVLLFGLDQGSRKNPFEMIDERVQFKPPVYSAAAPPNYS